MQTHLISQSIKIIRTEKRVSFRLAGKKEGVWGRNFCLPAISSSKFSLRPIPRRPKGRGRRGARLHMKSWLSFIEIFFKISPNLPVKAAPNGIFHFCRAKLPRILQLASHFLPRDPEVRLRGAQSSAQWYTENFTIAAELPIFCFRLWRNFQISVPPEAEQRMRQFFRLNCPCLSEELGS